MPGKIYNDHQFEISPGCVLGSVLFLILCLAVLWALSVYVPPPVEGGPYAEPASNAQGDPPGAPPEGYLTPLGVPFYFYPSNP